MSYIALAYLAGSAITTFPCRSAYEFSVWLEGLGDRLEADRIIQERRDAAELKRKYNVN